MTASKAIEYRITRRLLQRQDGVAKHRLARLADRVITVIAVTAALFLLGSYLQELLWALLAASCVLTLGTRTD
ncbi:MAG: hypothetical protein OEV47_16575 [Gammaproteobacteria bacterium]|nr:hypothetical protein [Gammaproteobacteria bacterium]